MRFVRNHVVKMIATINRSSRATMAALWWHVELPKEVKYVRRGSTATGCATEEKDKTSSPKSSSSSYQEEPAHRNASRRIGLHDHKDHPRQVRRANSSLVCGQVGRRAVLRLLPPGRGPVAARPASRDASCRAAPAPPPRPAGRAAAVGESEPGCTRSAPARACTRPQRPS